MIFPIVRSAVLSHMPGLAHFFRLLRDKSSAVSRPVTTPYGFRFSGDRSMTDPAYEKDEIKVFLRDLKQAAICIDVGANVGLYTCLAASFGKRVIAVEPLPRNLELLRRNLAANNFTGVEVLPFGLSNEIGVKRLFGTGGCASFQEGWAGSSGRHYQTVRVATLDSILMGMPGPMLIKVDVEGFEMEVLGGAVKTLNMNPRPTWLIEICLDGGCVVGGINIKFAETFELFWKCGYQAETTATEHRVVNRQDVNRWVAQGHVDFGTHNYIFR
jgi:FkbM family methyltransferase